MRTLLVAVVLSIVVLAGYMFYLRATNPCPTGYRFSVRTQHCRLTTPASSAGGGVSNAGGGVSGNQNGGNVNPQDNNCPPSSPPGCAVAPLPTNASPGCHWAVANCGVNPDWRSARFDVFFSDISKPSTKVSTSIFLEMEQNDASKMVCARVKGNIDVTVGGPTMPFFPAPSWSATETIPFDSSISSKYPMAVTSGAITPPNSPPPAGLIATFKAGCSPTVTRMIVHPFNDPENRCGCTTTVTR
jgi:hypothetical protein